ncbi:MAG: NTP transferase domain-containing protein, partial [Candidatus Heimdallarchaeota archaeon]|nr:NTP transferase domain-containing protein [Candidatus Heimdallarchaeota archaeon]
MKGVILAAGHGKRLLPLTSFRPKHMLPVAGKPILHHSLEYLRDVLDIKDIIIVVGYERQAIMDYFKNGEDLGIDITYVVQYAEKIRGLAAAVELVKEYISDDFIVFLGDNLFSADLRKVVDLHLKSKAAATLHLEENENPQRYGVVEIEGDNVLSLEEKPQNPKSNLVITGFYVFSPIIFDMIPKLKPSSRGEYELTDAIRELINGGHVVKAGLISGWRHDIGFPEDLLAVNRLYMNEETHSVKGEVINSEIRPPVYIAEGSKIENSIVGPYAMLEKGVEISNSTISNSVILEKSKLIDSVISNS